MKKQALLVAASLAVFASVRLPWSPAARAAGQDFSRFVDDYFEAQFRAQPSNATAVGFHQYDDQLEDLSRARSEARIAELKQLQSRLNAFDRSQLGFDDAIDAQALDGDIRSELQALETLRVWEKNPMPYVRTPGLGVDGLVKRDFAPAPQRLRSVIARLKASPAVYAALRANVQNPPREFTDLAIRMCKGAGGYFEGSLTQWAKQAAGGDAALLLEFEKANGVVVAETRSLAAWLEKDLL